MTDNQQLFYPSASATAPLGTTASMGEDISALQTLIDILSRTSDMGCEPCGGTGIRGRGLCERCRGRGTLLTPLAPAFNRF